MYYKNIGGQVSHTFQTSIIGFGQLLLQSILQVPRWITVGVPVLLIVLAVAWLWYNFIR